MQESKNKKQMGVVSKAIGIASTSTAIRHPAAGTCAWMRVREGSEDAGKWLKEFVQ